MTMPNTHMNMTELCNAPDSLAETDTSRGRPRFKAPVLS